MELLNEPSKAYLKIVQLTGGLGARRARNISVNHCKLKNKTVKLLISFSNDQAWRIGTKVYIKNWAVGWKDVHYVVVKLRKKASIEKTDSGKD